MGYLFVLLYLLVGIMYGAYLLSKCRRFDGEYDAEDQFECSVAGVFWPFHILLCAWVWAVRKMGGKIDDHFQF